VTQTTTPGAPNPPNATPTQWPRQASPPSHGIGDANDDSRRTEPTERDPDSPAPASDPATPRNRRRKRRPSHGIGDANDDSRRTEPTKRDPDSVAPASEPAIPATERPGHGGEPAPGTAANW